jgi:hypothetical protein
VYYLVTSATFRTSQHYQTSSVLIGIYVSLLANLIVSTTLFVWLWKARRSAAAKLGRSSSGAKEAAIPYTRLMRILVESAVPPLILGLIHLALRLASFKPLIPGLGILWVSVTVRKPTECYARSLPHPNPFLGSRSTVHRSQGIPSTRRTAEMDSGRQPRCSIARNRVQDAFGE